MYIRTSNSSLGKFFCLMLYSTLMPALWNSSSMYALLRVMLLSSLSTTKPCLQMFSLTCKQMSQPQVCQAGNGSTHKGLPAMCNMAIYTYIYAPGVHVFSWVPTCYSCVCLVALLYVGERRRSATPATIAVCIMADA
eukprot:GHRR01030789.1.p1 GENE.GHRR01030789.1~~GHRR01030789.1.p1  ORF type:complete len:137 (+),score=20.62 GHRR01030789.1:432-842(+)